MSRTSTPRAGPPDAKGDGPPRRPEWQCIGCGHIEAPRPCIGVCQDRRVELVHAGELDAVSAQLVVSQQRLAALEALVRRLAVTTPHEGECLRSWRAPQAEARRLLARTPRRGPTPVTTRRPLRHGWRGVAGSESVRGLVP